MVVHVGKTGGSTVVDILHMQQVHMVPVPLDKLCSRVVIAVREPVARIVSAFNWRFPGQQRDKPVARLSRSEEEMYSCAPTIQDYVSLFSAEGQCADLVRSSLKAGKGFGHLSRNYQFYFPDDETLNAVTSGRCWVIRQEHMGPDIYHVMEQLKGKKVAAKLAAQVETKKTRSKYEHKGNSILKMEEVAVMKGFLEREYHIYNELISHCSHANT